jgi:TolB-like protein
VYSLGVVLYELLTGSRPYRLKAGASVLQLEQAIATAQIERPSTQVGKDAGTDRSTTQDKLARRLRGDLDAIVMKALAKAPKDRYDSATALADDLQRYLSGEPVEARPDRLTYRLTKFVLRHRNGVALSVAAVVLVAATIGFELTRPVRGPGVAHPAPSATQTTAAAVSDKSIAVLPFVDMSEKKDQEYFSDGLSEELIDHLAHATDLKVIARTSSFQFKGKNEDMRSIASKLGVAHLLEGSVRKEGRTLRITAQLIRASDGSHLWSQTYDRNISGIFKLQDEIAGTVAQALKATLDISGTHPEVKTPNEEAHNLVLEGNFFLARESESDTQKAVDLYKQAIRLDPGYAMPWARLAVAYKNQGFLGWIPYADGTAKAKQAAQRSLQLDPNLVLAHYARLVILNDVDWDWAAAQAEVERIREIDPTDVFTLPKAEAYLAIIFGRVDEAIRIYRRILELDPLNSSALGNLAWAQYDANHLDDSVATWRRLIQVSPESFGNQAFMGIALTLLGQNEQALAAIEKESHEGIKQWALSIAYWSAGRKADSERALNKYKKDDAGNVYACFVAEIYAYRGDVDSAFEWLDRSYKHHGAGLESIKSDPLLRNLHSDPRFRELLVKMKLDGDGPQVDH